MRKRGTRHRSRHEAEAAPAGLFYLVQLVVHAGLLGVFVATFLPLFTALVPAFAIVESFVPHLAVLALVLTLPALLFRPRGFALLGPIALAWNLVILWPYLPLGSSSSGAVAEAKTPVLKVVSANVWYRNDGYAAALNYFEASDADVIAVIEGTSQWKKALEPLYAKYPYRIDCVDAASPCEALLLSKYPFRKSFAGPIEGHAPVILWGEISFAGKPIVVAATHLSWPLRAAAGNEAASTAGTLQPPPLAGSDPLLQSQQAQSLAQYLASLGPDLVLMGDFNSVPWGGTQKALRAATGLENDGPMVPTWPSWEPPWFLRLPIDQIMTRGALRRLDFRSGRYIGSDHLPVEAEITVTAE